ncbi:hypothetical protein [Pueribacillus sp. YX66]|uniref:hypothetical protein n=1 Tax=Pueribacillus sp. YX66 TaxID=3229242 RepID=UPI00358D0712
MSEEKKKRKKKKTIYVNELVVKADKVVFVDKDGKQKDDRREEPSHFVRDPWGFLFPRHEQQIEPQHVEEAMEESKKEHKEEPDEEQQRGWRWV